MKTKILLVAFFGLCTVAAQCSDRNTQKIELATTSNGLAQRTVVTIVRSFEGESWRTFDDRISRDYYPDKDELINEVREAAREVEEVDFELVFDSVIPGEDRYAVRFHWFRIWRRANSDTLVKSQGESEWHVYGEQDDFRLIQTLGDKLW